MAFQLNFPGADPGKPDVADLHSNSQEEVSPNPVDEEMTLLLKELAALENTVEGFEETFIKPHQDKQAELSAKADKEYQAYLDSKRAYDELIAQEREQAFKAKQELASLNSKLNKLRLAKLDVLAKSAAQERMDALSKKLDNLVKDISWWSTLFEFQREDIQFMAGAFEADRSGVLLANDMGLGKTAECATLIPILTQLFYQKYDRKPRILWLTKKSLIKGTITEIRRWDKDRMLIPVIGQTEGIRDTLVEMAVVNNAVCVANYEAMSSTKTLRNVTWDIIFMDEVHRLKGGANPSGPTQIWQNAKALCEKAKFLVPLSGTPIQNRPQEVWAYLHLFDPIRFPNVRRFEKEYCWGWPDIKVNFEVLIKVLKDQVIRRSTVDVDIQLPDSTRVFIPVEMSGRQLDLYNQMRSNFFIWLDDQHEKNMTATAIIAQLTRLRQIAAFPGSLKITDPETGAVTTLDCDESVKIDEAMDIIDELVLAGEQVVVFSSQFNAPIEEVVRRCQKAGYTAVALTGENSHKSDEIEVAFQQKELDVLCINMKTGSEGLNLQKSSDKWPGGASHSIFIDLGWNPASNEQAEKRIHRPGAKNACFYHIIQAVDSVDAYIAEILERKSEMTDSIMESNELRKGSDWKSYLIDLI